MKAHMKKVVPIEKYRHIKRKLFEYESVINDLRKEKERIEILNSDLRKQLENNNQKKYQYLLNIKDIGDISPNQTVNSFYKLIEDQMEGLNNPPLYYDLEMVIGPNTWYLHDVILSARCRQIDNEMVISKLKEISLNSSKILLKWIYNGYIIIDQIDITLNDLKDLYILYKLITDNQNIHYLFIKLIYLKVSYLEDELLIEEFKKSIYNDPDELIDLFYINISKRESLDEKLILNCFRLLQNHKSYLKYKGSNDNNIQKILDTNEISIPFYDHQFNEHVKLISESKTDITFKLSDNDMIHGHKSIISYRAPFINDLLKNNEDNHIIETNNINLKFSAFKRLIQYYYLYENILFDTENDHEDIIDLYIFIISYKNESKYDKLGYIEPLLNQLSQILFNENISHTFLSNSLNYLMNEHMYNNNYEHLLLHYINYIKLHEDSFEKSIIKPETKILLGLFGIKLN